MAAAQRAPGSWRGKGLGMGQREKSQRDSPSKLPRSSLCALPFSVHMATALAPSHFLREQPRESLSCPQPCPASPESLPDATGSAMPPNKAAVTRMAQVTQGLAQGNVSDPEHAPNLSHSPPKLLVFSPLCPQTPQETTAITAININPHLCTRIKKPILLDAFPGFFQAWSGGSGRTSEGYFLTKPPQHLWLVRSEQPGNEVTLTLWEVNKAETPKAKQGIFCGVGMMQPCRCGDFPGFPGKLNCAFPWWDENLGPTTHTAGPQHRDTSSGTSPICLKTSHPQNASLSPSISSLLNS